MATPPNPAGAVREPPAGLQEVNYSAGQPDLGSDDRVSMVVNRQKRSYMWMQTNYHDQWEQVFKSYKCERAPEKDENEPTKEDPTRTSIGMPDTWMVVRRTVARLTAQIPNLRFNGKDPETSELIGRSLMYQWDRAKIQRIQKKHCTQAALFGWSVRPWYWSVEEYDRTRRVNPVKEQLDPADVDQIVNTYGPELDKIAANLGYSREQVLEDPKVRPIVMSELLANHSRGGMLPVDYSYKGYEGPRADFLLVSDCFPEPNFTSIQNSNWFIIERRRNLAWLEKLVARYEDFRPGVMAMLEKYPDGTTWNYQTNETSGLRRRLISAIGRVDNSSFNLAETQTKEWTIQEMWVPGPRPTLTMVGEKSVLIGVMPAPYALDGMIPFTELVLVDDLLAGIGDCTARVMRGLQLLHDRQTNTRTDLAYNIMRPLVACTDQVLYDQAEMRLKRGAGFRLVLMRSKGDLDIIGEQAAMAAMSTAMQDDNSIMRAIQGISGETNMSMSADADPQQGRTATGARIMAYNQDILTKDLVDAFNESSLNADAEMMYRLNRSELSSAIEFQPGRYRRLYTTSEDMFKEEWVKAEPELFQTDGEITAEVGSTLADDDEAKMTKATNLFQASVHYPELINAKKATQDYLIANGKGKELAQYQPDPQPPPPEPPMNKTLTVSAKWSELTPEEKQAIMNSAHVQIRLVPPDDPQLQPPAPPGAPPLGGGAMPPGPTPPGAGAPPPPGAGPMPGPGPASPSPALMAAGALAAAKGHSPLANGGLPQ